MNLDGTSPRHFTVNAVMDGQPCVGCGMPLRMGEESVACNVCQAAHHVSCWEGTGGCATPDCPNQPRADAPVSAAARRFRANRILQGQPCAACSVPLQLGEELVACQDCQAVHHARCYDQAGGCATPSCDNRPLARLPDPQPAPAASAYGAPSGYAAPAAAGVQVSNRPAPPAGRRYCPTCNNLVSVADPMCVFCDHVFSADGIYRGPKVNAPGAVASVVLGIVGFFVCGPILGGIAIAKANEAKRNIAANPRYGGEGLATAGMVLGIVDIAFFVLSLVFGALSSAIS